MAVLLKVYGHVYPAPPSLEADLSAALSTAIPDTLADDVPVLERDGDMLRISFEGLYFPEEEVTDCLQKHLDASQQGKLDILDLENWMMTRYMLRGGEMTKRSANLNSVLDYSGF